MADSQIASIYRWTAAVCVGLVLTLAAASASPRLHAWLHGASQVEHDDDCAVTVFSGGVSPSVAVLVVAPPAYAGERVGCDARRVVIGEPAFSRPFGCGPP